MAFQEMITLINPLALHTRVACEQHRETIYQICEQHNVPLLSIVVYFIPMSDGPSLVVAFTKFVVGMLKSLSLLYSSPTTTNVFLESTSMDIFGTSNFSTHLSDSCHLMLCLLSPEGCTSEYLRRKKKRRKVLVTGMIPAKSTQTLRSSASAKYDLAIQYSSK